MTVAYQSSSHCINGKNDDNLEIFILIWLDTKVDKKKHQNTFEKLRPIINHIKIFHDGEECKRYVERRSRHDRLLLIVNDQSGRQIVASVHEFQQISRIYVKSTDKKTDEQWARNFTKVKVVASESEELVSQIEMDYKNQLKKEELVSDGMFIASGNAGKSTTGINGQFIFSQLLIDCLLQLPSNEMDRKELISCFEKEYNGNRFELEYLDEFQNNYTCDKALWWYTRQSFFYKTLNAALRKQNIYMIFLYRSYLVDLRSQLQHYQCPEHVKVYRSQLMSLAEINDLTQSIGQFISVNSFLSTSKQREVADLYMADGSDPIDYERVLFEIEAEPKVVATKPYADIHRISHFADEFEVLFMVGSIFRLNSILRDEKKVWIVKMSLSGEEEHDLKEVLADMKRQIGIGNTNLWTLGKLLRRMGKFDLAEEYYNRMLKEVPLDDPSISSLYIDLAEIASLQGNFDTSVDWHKKSLDVKKRNPQSDSTQKEHTLDFLLIPSKNIELHESIGDGAFGTVYRATWLPRNHIVAVKTLHLTHWNEKAKKDFFKELSLIDILRSPNIVNFYGACIEMDKFALVMEYMPLGSLYKILHTDKINLDWSDRLSIALQTTKGINYLHTLSQIVLHRDIKSSNFLLARSHPEYIVKVCDFGLAETRLESTRKTQLNHTFFGTIQWSAPEIFRMKKHTDKSDIYSLGMVYWEIATNEIPYDGHQGGIICEFVLRGDRLDIPECVPSDFASLIQNCWTTNPEDRPNCSQMIKIIEECIANQNNLEDTDGNADTTSKTRCSKTRDVNLPTPPKAAMEEIPSLRINRQTNRVIPNIPANACWSPNGVTVAGGNGGGSNINQLNNPFGFFVDDDQTVVIADRSNSRVVQWKKGDKNGKAVAGGNGQGTRLDQLNYPTDVLIDKETDSLIICDRWNERVVRLSRRSGSSQGEILIDNIECGGLAMDDQKNLYVSDIKKHEVRRYQTGDKNGTVVAGGNGSGANLNQLSAPTYSFVNRQQTVYVSDHCNHRVMKWDKGVTEGIVVAGGHGQGNSLTQLSYPQGLFVDILGTLYIADSGNNRVLRWPQDSQQATIIAARNGTGSAANQLSIVIGLSFDHQGNMYVVDFGNHRVQRFSIE